LALRRRFLMWQGGSGASVAAERCTFLQTIGGVATTPIVNKQVRPRQTSRPRRTGTPTHSSTSLIQFQVLFFTPNSSASRRKNTPVEGFRSSAMAQNLQADSIEVMKSTDRRPHVRPRFAFLSTGKQASQY